ncbi:MAG: hypothetical protein JO127_11495 [Caulobacteraceae bacterium]|nr:hypothetical protein [Caulobacteraceae bacterium]
MNGPEIIETDSSVLVSSSQYLNHPGMREFFTTQFLRKNGKDRVPFTDNFGISRSMNELRDKPAVEAWFERERLTCPPLNRWMAEKHISTFTAEDLAKCPPGSLGGIYCELVNQGFELDVGLNLQTRDWYEYAMARYSRNHDFEHILTGGQFTFPGEYVPLYAMMTNTHTYMSPEFAAFIGLRSALASMRLLARAALHYPKSVWPFFECIAQGVKVGLDSDPIRLLKIDDLLNLPLEEAREKAGVRGAYEVQTEPWASHFLNPSDPEALAADAHLPYIRRGTREVTTASSVPVSSSKYLNDVRLREWTPVAMLRKAGPDYPDRAEYRHLETILQGLRDRPRLDALTAKAVADDAALGARLSQPCPVDGESLSKLPSGALGAALLRRLRTNGDLDLLVSSEGTAWERLYRQVALAEEILAVVLGGTGDALDGVMPGWAMVVSLYRDLDPDLAGELCNGRILGLLRFVSRTQIHYPRSWIAVARAMRQGILIGQASAPLFSLPYEQVLALTPAEARERLAIRNWQPIDTRLASEAYGERSLHAAA